MNQQSSILVPEKILEYTKDFLGRRDYFSEDEIIQFIKYSKNYNPNDEKLIQAIALKFFHTSKQQTWLISTNMRLYNILDDNRYDKPHIIWSIPKRDLINDNKVSIRIITRDYSKKIGLLDIGHKHKNWYYTKELFVGSDVKNEIQRLIAKSMNK